MKTIIVGVILSLAFLKLFQCAPLIASEDGVYTETRTSSSWGFNAGVDANLGLEAGYKEGHATLGSKNHFAVNLGGHKQNGRQDLTRAVPAAQPPNYFGLGFDSPYYMQYPAQYTPQVETQFYQETTQQAPRAAPHAPRNGTPKSSQETMTEEEKH